MTIAGLRNRRPTLWAGFILGMGKTLQNNWSISCKPLLSNALLKTSVEGKSFDVSFEIFPSPLGFLPEFNPRSQMRA